MDDTKILETLVKNKKLYYETGRSYLTDSEFDALEETFRQKNPNHPYFEEIGSEPSKAWKSSTHKIIMGSLDKIHTKEDFIKWSSKYNNELFTLQLKLDGLSLSMDYENGLFIKAITRGDKIKGEDISSNVRLMKNFLNQTKDNFTGSIRSEIILGKSDFININNTFIDGDKYSNPRNAAAGISRRLDGKFCKYLQLISYDITEYLNEDEKIGLLGKLGFITLYQKTGNINNIIAAFETLKWERPNLLFDIDGAVIKVCSKEIQKKEGYSRSRPKAQRAWKFDPPSAVTTFIKETWDVGRTGVITPLANLEPIEIDGSTVSKATLHNIAQIKKLNIGRGDLVRVIKAGDITPQIESVIEHKGNPIIIPDTCPSCGGLLRNDETKIFCDSDICPRKNLNRILYWIKSTKIKSFGEALAEELNKIDKLNKISDIYKITKEDISIIEGWGESSAEKILNSIGLSRELSPEIFLSAIGIPGISSSTSKELLSNFKSLSNLFNITVGDIIKIKGFSDISANSIVEGLKKYKLEIEELMSIISFESKDKKGKLINISFCFTGTMSEPRSYYQKIVAENGGTNYSSVTKDLTYLVCNEDQGSNKSQKATKYGVKVITEKEFLDLVGVDIKIEEQVKIQSYSLF